MPLYFYQLGDLCLVDIDSIQVTIMSGVMQYV